MAQLLVDPDDLRTAAGLIGDASTLIGPAVEARSADLAPAGASAWTTNRTLSDALAVWGPLVKCAYERMASSATNLRAMADAFVDAEWTAAERQRLAGGAWPG